MCGLRKLADFTMILGLKAKMNHEGGKGWAEGQSCNPTVYLHAQTSTFRQLSKRRNESLSVQFLHLLSDAEVIEFEQLQRVVGRF
jgi:hypothetical protein